MKIEVNHSCKNFESFRAQKVKSLFNAENGHEWKHTAELPIEDNEWQIGLIVGASGSGKSTLLNILGILDDYETGDYHLNNIMIKNLSEKQAAVYRNELIGFVFQSFNLINFKIFYIFKVFKLI